MPRNWLEQGDDDSMDEATKLHENDATESSEWWIRKSIYTVYYAEFFFLANNKEEADFFSREGNKTQIEKRKGYDGKNGAKSQ